METYLTNWDSEVFKVVDVGDDLVALWSPSHGRFIKTNKDSLCSSPLSNRPKLLDHWHSERFRYSIIDLN